MMDMKQTDNTFSEKPGICCLASLNMGKKAILATGGFDRRIKVVSFKTLKPLLSLPFHQGIVN